MEQNIENGGVKTWNKVKIKGGSYVSKSEIMVFLFFLNF